VIYAYIRQIPHITHLVEQKHEVLAFSLAKGLHIDKEVIEYATKNLPIEERNKFESFLQTMQKGDTVIVSHLAMLSDRTEELIKVITCMLSRGIELWIANAKVLLNRQTNSVDIFPLLNDLREAQKEKTNHIGRPKGSKSNSKFDIYQNRIITLLNSGMNVSAISRELEVSRSSLKDYIESRGIKSLVEGDWIEMSDVSNVGDLDNGLLICPFEEERKNKKVS
jgi:DNA invertase Pin-like site-specific DNA recombinase